MRIERPAPILAAFFLMAAAPSKAPTPDRAFVEQVKKAAAPSKLVVAGLWRGDLDGEPSTTEYVALLCAGTPEDNAGGGEPERYLILQDAAHAWAVEVTRNAGSRCADAREEGKWSKLAGTLELSDGYSTWDASMKVAIRDGQLVRVASESGGHSMETSSREAYDWEALTFNAASGDIGGEHATKTNGAVVPVIDRPDAKLPPVWNEPVSGKDKWTGAADASLSVRAAQKDGAVELALSATDDARLPVPPGTDAKAFLAADHLELWWAVPREEPCGPSEPKSCAIRHLGIGAREDGSWDVRWLEPASEPLPSVTGKLEAFSVTVPVAWLAKPDRLDGSWWAAFTAVYSDSDAAGAGQQTLVATSRLKWGKSGTFGRLVRLKGGARYPAVDAPLMVDAQVRPWKPGAPLPRPE